MVEETKKISKRTKLFEELEKKYADDASKEAENKRFEKLKEIKAQHQPVSKDEIMSHAKKYEDIIRQKREELRQKRGVLGLDKASLHGNPPPPQVAITYETSERIKNYKSKFYLEQVEEDKEIKHQREKVHLEKKKLAEKANSYAKYVREMYAPTTIG